MLAWVNILPRNPYLPLTDPGFLKTLILLTDEMGTFAIYGLLCAYKMLILLNFHPKAFLPPPLGIRKNIHPWMIRIKTSSCLEAAPAATPGGSNDSAPLLSNVNQLWPPIN